MVSGDNEVFYGRRHPHRVPESPAALSMAEEKWRGRMDQQMQRLGGGQDQGVLENLPRWAVSNEEE